MAFLGWLRQPRHNHPGRAPALQQDTTTAETNEASETTQKLIAARLTAATSASAA